MSFHDIPRSGDIHGEAFEGHRVNRLWAVVVVQANGDEGLASAYTFDDKGKPTGRMTLVASTDPVWAYLEEVRKQIEPPEGGRLEWREFEAINTEERA